MENEQKLPQQPLTHSLKEGVIPAILSGVFACIVIMTLIIALAFNLHAHALLQRFDYSPGLAFFGGATSSIDEDATIASVSLLIGVVAAPGALVSGHASQRVSRRRWAKTLSSLSLIVTSICLILIAASCCETLSTFAGTITG